MAKMKTKVDLDVVRRHCSSLIGLLDENERGLLTWNQMVAHSMADIVDEIMVEKVERGR